MWFKRAIIALLFINSLFGVLGKAVYIFLWSVFSFTFECVIVYVTGVLHYQGWSIWYTAIVYPTILTTIALAFYYTQHLIRDNKAAQKRSVYGVILKSTKVVLC